MSKDPEVIVSNKIIELFEKASHTSLSDELILEIFIEMGASIEDFKNFVQLNRISDNYRHAWKITNAIIKEPFDIHLHLGNTAADFVIEVPDKKKPGQFATDLVNALSSHSVKVNVAVTVAISVFIPNYFKIEAFAPILVKTLQLSMPKSRERFVTLKSKDWELRIDARN